MKGSVGVYGSSRLEALVRIIEKQEMDDKRSLNAVVEAFAAEVDTVVDALGAIQE